MLKKCKIIGLPGNDSLELNFSKITTLTGPNGTGKSSVLRVLHLLFSILGENEVCDKLPAHEKWNLFKRAELTFECNSPLQTDFFGEIKSFVVCVECDDATYYISDVISGEKSFSISKPILKSDLRHWTEQAKLEKQKLAHMARELDAAAPHLVDQVNKGQYLARKEASEREAKFSKEIESNEKIQVEYQEGKMGTDAAVERSKFSSFLAQLDIPSIKIITTEQLMEQNVRELIDHLISLKKGNKAAVRKFNASAECLNKLLQSEIDVHEVNNKQTFLINGISFEKASNGTFLTLAFFALTESEERNKIILWDEPENGLHPTRRIQLLDHMRADGRQFVIATHAMEFAPVLQQDSHVFRCVGDYDEDASQFRFIVTPVATRRDAFLTLEALGIHPARTLFTANVVIWVEGPTELMFYRHWLSNRLKNDGYLEGLHYSFMQYGGSLINYLEVANDSELKSTIDLLSHCRHPVVLVDSDIGEASQMSRSLSLKPGAKRLSNEIELLNTERPGAAIFQATEGREIENYVPKLAIIYAMEKLWNEFSEIKGILPLDRMELGPYSRYPDAIGEFLKAEGIVDGNDLPRGRSIWGAANKVEMMVTALSMPGFDENMLQLNCCRHLDEIDKFIRSKHNTDYPNGVLN